MRFINTKKQHKNYLISQLETCQDYNLSNLNWETFKEGTERIGFPIPSTKLGELINLNTWYPALFIKKYDFFFWKFNFSNLFIYSDKKISAGVWASTESTLSLAAIISFLKYDAAAKSYKSNLPEFKSGKQKFSICMCLYFD